MAACHHSFVGAYLHAQCMGWRLLLQATGNTQTPLPTLWRLFKLTVTGFALNYVTPVGLLGGEPYRIMELQGEVGAVRASSSTILHSMMHIFSHFCFWCFSIVLCLALHHAVLSSAALVYSLWVSFSVPWALRSSH